MTSQQLSNEKEGRWSHRGMPGKTWDRKWRFRICQFLCKSEGSASENEEWTVNPEGKATFSVSVVQVWIWKENENYLSPRPETSLMCEGLTNVQQCDSVQSAKNSQITDQRPGAMASILSGQNGQKLQLKFCPLYFPTKPTKLATSGGPPEHPIPFHMKSGLKCNLLMTVPPSRPCTATSWVQKLYTSSEQESDKIMKAILQIRVLYHIPRSKLTKLPKRSFSECRGAIG